MNCRKWCVDEKGKEVDVTVWRDEEEKTIKVSVGGNSDSAETASAGQSDSTELARLDSRSVN